MELSLPSMTGFATHVDSVSTKAKNAITSVAGSLMARVMRLTETVYYPIHLGSLRNASRGTFTEENESLQDAGNVF